MLTPEIFYKVPWRASGSFPGHHASQQRGAGLRFRNHVPLTHAPDPRRFDVRASLRDPFEQLQIRVFEQSSSIRVFLLADLSASMSYAGAHDKRNVTADFIGCLSFSAYRTGDAFGFVGCGGESNEPLVLPPTFNRAAGADLAEQVRSLPFEASSATGLLRAADFVGGRRALVFLLSDFHFPDALLARLMDALAYHEVVPVVLWDPLEHDHLPGFGLARVVDPETRRTRLLFMRPGLRQRIREHFSNRRAHLVEFFARHRRRPLFLENGFQPDDVSRHFFV